MFFCLPWSHNKSLSHQENSTYLSLAKPDTQERSSHTSASFVKQPHRDVFLSSSLSSGPYLSVNPLIPHKNSICCTKAGRILPEVIWNPPRLVNNCLAGYHLPPPPSSLCPYFYTTESRWRELCSSFSASLGGSEGYIWNDLLGCPFCNKPFSNSKVCMFVLGSYLFHWD